MIDQQRKQPQMMCCVCVINMMDPANVWLSSQRNGVSSTDHPSILQPLKGDQIKMTFSCVRIEF